MGTFPDDRGSGDVGADPLLDAGTKTVASPVWPPIPLPVVFDGIPPPVEAVETGPSNGVAGADGDGLADSTTQRRWEWVATSLATE